MESLDDNNTKFDTDPNPKSFFVDSPPESPLQPHASGSNPFSQLKDSVVARLTTKGRPGSSDGPRRSKHSRPGTNDSSTSRKSDDHPSGSSPFWRNQAHGPESQSGDPRPSGLSDSHSAEYLQTVTFPSDITSRSQSKSSNRSSFIFPNTGELFRRATTKRAQSPRPTPAPSPPPEANGQMPEGEDEVLDISSPEPTSRLQDETMEKETQEGARELAIRSVGLHSTRPSTSAGKGSTVSPIQEEVSEEDEPSNDVNGTTSDKTDSLPPEPSNSSPPLVIRTLSPHPPNAFPPNTTPQIPAFPAAYPTVSPFIKRSACIPRYEEHGLGLSHFVAKSKTWKSRLVCITSVFSEDGSFCRNYLHIFKHSTPTGDNVEVDRLEIDQNSVVFIFEEEIGGRRHALLIGGPDGTSGAVKRHRTGQSYYKDVDPSNQLCILNVEDPKERQSWIGDIKSHVLELRAEAAGLAPQGNLRPQSTHGPGDLDLALTIRTDDLNINHSLPPISPMSPLTFSTLDSSTQLDVPSRTQSEISLEPSRRVSAVSTLRGFFSSTTLPQDQEDPTPKTASNLLKRFSKLPQNSGSRGNTNQLSIRSIFRTSILAPSSRRHFDPIGTYGRPEGSVSETHLSSATYPPPTLTLSRSSESIEAGTTSSGLVAAALPPLNMGEIDASDKLKMHSIVPRVSQEERSPQTPEEHRAEAFRALSTPRSKLPPGAALPAIPSRQFPFDEIPSTKTNGRGRNSLFLEKPLPPIVPSSSSPPFGGRRSGDRRSSSETANRRRSRHSRRLSNDSGSTHSGSDRNRASRASVLVTFNRTSIPPPRRPVPTFAPPPIPIVQASPESSKSLPRQARLSQSYTPATQLPPSRAPPTGPLPPLPPSERLSPNIIAHERPRLHSAPSPSAPDTSIPYSRPTPVLRHPFSQVPGDSPSDDNDDRHVAVSSRHRHRRPLPPLPNSPNSR